MDFYERAMEHRTIRNFKDKKLDDEILEKIFDIAMKTATSMGSQQASIINVTDEKKKKEISEVCGQDYVGTAPYLFIFIADNFRNKKIYEELKGEYERDKDTDKFFQGLTDAILMAQNVYSMIESLGMGAVFLGSVLNDSEKIIEILDLPELTFPILGLAFGYPDENPQMKPRMDKKFRVFENSYKILDNYTEALKDYDEEMKTYYDLRDKNNRTDTFTAQVIKIEDMSITNRQDLIEIARKNGYKL